LQLLKALLAGVLTWFGLQALTAGSAAVVALMLLIYPLATVMPRYAVVLTLAGGILLRARAARLVVRQLVTDPAGRGDA
jgi:predicted benzoate:H+ symporter BenE